MAKQCMVRRELKRAKLIEKYKVKRAELKVKLNDPNLDLDEKQAVIAAYRKLPRDSSKTRLTTRCNITGRPRAVYSRFGLSRNELRRRAMLGEVPGLVKASW